MAVRGQVDGLEGAYVVGWAVREGCGECQITVRAADGEIVATGRASRNRPDLSSLGVGRTNIAFRIPIEGAACPGLLTTFADDELISAVPIEVGPGLFDGQITIRGAIITGWVTERTPVFVPPVITIIDQAGRVLARAVAEFADQQADPFFTPAEFRAQLDDAAFDRPELRLTACANGVPFAHANSSLTIQGTLETVNEARCSGWLFSPEAPDRELELDIFVNGALATATRCNQSRIDVKDVFPQCGAPGFTASLPDNPQPATSLTTLSVRLRGSDRDLFEGPYVVGSPAAVVCAARKAASALTGNASPLSAPEQAVMQTAIADLLGKTRLPVPFVATKLHRPRPRDSGPRLNIIIPIYRGTQVTAECIHSVLAYRAEADDRVILVNDSSPEHDMAGVLRFFATKPNVVVLTNAHNEGFIRSVNRGLRFSDLGDVLLLNSDTEMFPGGLDELWRVGQSNRNIGTVTALSNNATIFSYPHFNLRSEVLLDIAWVEIAAHAYAANFGQLIDMPTGHGFCMLIKREVLDKVGLLDEGFGRGYGEENDFCSRAADLGYRNVVATGAFVRHRESVSFGDDEREAILKINLPALSRRYPEYTSMILEAERADALRAARWPLDMERLRRIAARGQVFALVISNGLGGGTQRAIRDIETSVGYGRAVKIGLQCRDNGYFEVQVSDPGILAVFAETEVDELFKLLSAAPITLVVAHQLLGFPESFILTLMGFARTRNSVYYAHDFYSICPRVTMIDATGEFCDVGPTDMCARCVVVGGVHESSRTSDLMPAAHRTMFGEVLASFRHIVAPSVSAAAYLERAFPGINVKAIPHPEPALSFPSTIREGSGNEVVLLGALGPHKGSRKLLEVAKRARLVWPELRFRVIGYTDIDEKLMELGNVTITGAYKPQDLERHLRASRARTALFLSTWPETFSYTLSEAVSHGFLPFVPDLGAPADRVRASGFGVIFPFPIDPAEVVRALAEHALGKDVGGNLEGPPSFARSETASTLTRQLFEGTFTPATGGAPYPEGK